MWLGCKNYFFYIWGDFVRWIFSRQKPKAIVCVCVLICDFCMRVLNKCHCCTDCILSSILQNHVWENITFFRNKWGGCDSKKSTCSKKICPILPSSLCKHRKTVINSLTFNLTLSSQNVPALYLNWPNLTPLTNPTIPF